MMGGFGGSSGVLTLVDFSKVKIAIEVDQNVILRIRKGQPAEVRVSSYPGRAFPGAVTIANLAADPLSKLFGVEVTVDNGDLALRPGMFGEVSIEVESRDAALVVPQKAIVGQSFLFVVRNGQAVKRAVRVGLQTADAVEILSGLEEGESVVVEGSYTLEDGAPVQLNDEVRK